MNSHYFPIFLTFFRLLTTLSVKSIDNNSEYHNHPADHCNDHRQHCHDGFVLTVNAFVMNFTCVSIPYFLYISAKRKINFLLFILDNLF